MSYSDVLKYNMLTCMSSRRLSTWDKKIGDVGFVGNKGLWKLCNYIIYI